MASQTSPNLTHPIPNGENPIEINTDDLHSKPEVDIGVISPDQPFENPSHPDGPDIPNPEREEPPRPE